MWRGNNDNGKASRISLVDGTELWQIVHEIQFMSEGRTMAFVR